MKRRDNKNRVLRTGESVRKDGKYQFKYSMNGKPRFLYSWRLEPADSLPQGKRPSISLREKEKRLRGLHPDVALMQYTKQGPIHVSELANAIGPSVLIPHHHDLKVPFHDEITQEKLKLLKECYKGKLICPENGQWLEF